MIRRAGHDESDWVDSSAALGMTQEHGCVALDSSRHVGMGWFSCRLEASATKSEPGVAWFFSRYLGMTFGKSLIDERYISSSDCEFR